MAKELLTEAAVRNAKPGMHCDGAGLYLQVTTAADGSPAKSWVLRFPTGRTVTSASGKQRREERNMGLGSLNAVDLYEARRLADKARQHLADGLDPLEQRRKEKGTAQERKRSDAKAMTFDRCAESYMQDHRAGWRNPKHASQWKATLAGYASPVLGKVMVQAIDTDLVMKVLRPIWTTKPETASRVRGRMEAVLNWAKAHDCLTGENPARWHGHLENLLPPRSKVRAVKHHAALPYAELPAFMDALRAQQASTSARALEYAILTAARTGEVIGARWAEIDLRAKVWTVPGERMKGGRDHRVPLSGPALAILKAQADVRENEHVFPGDRRAGLSNMALLMTLRRMGRDDVTAHGFRSSFRDWAGNETDFPRELIEAALAHVVGDKAEQAYRRSDALERRRVLMSKWSEFCAKAVTGTVVPMRA